jgi:hypothetical protein
MGTGSESTENSMGLVATILRHRRVFAACVLVGLTVGLGAGAAVPVKYTAQARLIAGATSVAAAAVPSYAQAGISLAETYSRVFESDGVQRVLHTRFGDGKLAITASPVAGSSVVLIEASASDPATATRLADAGTDALVQVVTALLNNDRNVKQATASLNDGYARLNAAQATLASLQRDRLPATDSGLIKAQADVQTAQTAVSAYAAQLSNEVENTAASNGIQRLASATITSDTGLQRFELYGVIGIFLGIGVGVVLAYVLESRRTTKAPSTTSVEAAYEQGDRLKPDRRSDNETTPSGVVGYHSAQSPHVPNIGGAPGPWPWPSPRAGGPASAQGNARPNDLRARTPGGRR